MSVFSLIKLYINVNKLCKQWITKNMDHHLSRYVNRSHN